MFFSGRQETPRVRPVPGRDDVRCGTMDDDDRLCRGMGGGERD